MNSSRSHLMAFATHDAAISSEPARTIRFPHHRPLRLEPLALLTLILTSQSDFYLRRLRNSSVERSIQISG